MTAELKALRDQAVATAQDETRFPALPLGEAHTMGNDPSGKPLIDPRVFDSPEFFTL